MREIIRTVDSNDGIVSNDRVKQQGEVYTPDNIVRDMLNMVDESLQEDGKYNLDSKEGMIKLIDLTYLEPSCGNGNFLIRILDNKLKIIHSMLEKYPEERNRKRYWLLRATSKIYGVDILHDNVESSINRMLELIFYGATGVLMGTNTDASKSQGDKYGFYSFNENGEIVDSYSEYIHDEELRNNLEFILEHNIQMGNTLTNEGWDSSYGVAATSHPYTEMYVLDYMYSNTDDSVEITKEPFKNAYGHSDNISKYKYNSVFELYKHSNELKTPSKADDSIIADDENGFDF